MIIGWNHYHHHNHHFIDHIINDDDLNIRLDYKTVTMQFTIYFSFFDAKLTSKHCTLWTI